MLTKHKYEFVSLQDLNFLIERYLNPLQEKSFLPQDEVSLDQFHVS